MLTYTTDPLDQDVEVIGEVSAEIWFRSSLRFADVFVRLCDVDLRNRSFNVCDGLISLTGADVNVTETLSGQTLCSSQIAATPSAFIWGSSLIFGTLRLDQPEPRPGVRSGG